MATMVELNRLRPKVPIILSSGYSEDQIADSPGNATPAAFLPKPYDFDELARVLQKVLTPKD
jgi:CheY-like chemotaxis protein